MKTECDYLYGWIKKTFTYQKISPKTVNPRDIAGNAEEEEEMLEIRWGEVSGVAPLLLYCIDGWLVGVEGSQDDSLMVIVIYDGNPVDNR